ncbi:hypothetical protein [Nonomuraea insulae]|uniref:Secreted protein n=1 Tax=Nonomuraea insulae TaxID=1616787 RepID=A0ABW1D444_9ACTN
MLRTRLPAALLLFLSWFLPATAHARAVQQVTAVTWQAEQHQSGMRQVPPPAQDVRAWAGPGSVTGASAALADGPPAFRSPWAVVVPGRAADAPAARRPRAATARAPPSTTL